MTARLEALFTPLALGDLTLPNRVVMAPLTRARAHVWQRSVDSTGEKDLGFFDMRPEPAPDGTQLFVAILPPNDCASPYRYVGDAEDAEGKRYGDPKFVKAC